MAGSGTIEIRLDELCSSLYNAGGCAYGESYGLGRAGGGGTYIGS